MKHTSVRSAPLPKTRTVEEVVADLRERGFLPGAPPHVTAYTRHVDAAECRRRTCGRCGARKMGCLPWHRKNEYKALAVCPLCRSCEEA